MNSFNILSYLNELPVDTEEIDISNRKMVKKNDLDFFVYCFK